MASDWMLNELKLSPKQATKVPVSSAVAPTATIKQQLPAVKTVPQKFTPVPSTKPTATTPHGQYMSGNIINKGLDLLRTPEYAMASFGKGVQNKVKDLTVDAKKSGYNNYFQKFGLAGVVDAAGSGVKNILPGIGSRTQLGRETGDLNSGAYLTKNPVGQSAFNFTASLGSPNLPIGKGVDIASKIASKVPIVSKVAPAVAKIATKVGGVAQQYLKESPTVAKFVEKIPGLEYARNPEVGKILEGAKDVANTRVSKLFNQVNDMAQGLSKVERIKIGNLIEGGVVTKQTEHLATRVNAIKQMSDEIGKELVDLGVMTKETFSKYKGQYLSHIADVVKNEESVKGTGGGVNFFLNSLKERGNKLGTNGLPDYIREFQFPTFKALAGEINTAESTKAIQQIATRFGQKVEPQTKTVDLARELLNTLTKEYKAPKTGLGEMGFEQTAAYKESLLPVIDFLKKQIPAMSPEGLRMGTKLVAGKVMEQGTKAVDDITGVGTPGYKFPNVPGVPGEEMVTKGAKAVLGKVGEMAQKAQKTFLPTAKEAGGFEKTISGPRKTAGGLVSLEDVLPQTIGKQFKDVGIPQEVADYVTRRYAKSDPNLLMRVAEKALGAWKLGKTIYGGPAYHMRNMMSNMILSDFSTGAGLPSTLMRYAKAVQTYRGKGTPQMTAYLQEMKDAGIINRVNISEGIKELKPSAFGQAEGTLSKIAKSPIKLQNAMEETAKLGVFSFWREKGATIEKAAKKAEEAIFSPHKISETERSLVKGAIPFYSFARQAIPFTAKTAYRNPSRITKYEKAKTAVEGLSPEGTSNNAQLPEDRRGEVRLPGKNKRGNYNYFDPTYILPYGGLGEDNMGLSANPLLTEAAQQGFNKDLYFQQPIAKSKVPARGNAQRAQHAFQTFAPNILPTDFAGGIPTGQSNIALKTRGGSKIYDAVTNQKDYAGRTRSKTQASLDTIGLKSSEFDPKEQNKFDSIDRNARILEINKEIKSTIRDQRISPQDKRTILQQLQQERLNTLRR